MDRLIYSLLDRRGFKIISNKRGYGIQIEVTCTNSIEIALLFFRNASLSCHVDLLVGENGDGDALTMKVITFSPKLFYAKSKTIKCEISEFDGV
jgi:hypothetical protein